MTKPERPPIDGPPATKIAGQSTFLPSNRDRRLDTPRRVRGGLRLRASDETLAESPLAQRVLVRIEALTQGDALAEGLQYARSGQVASIAFEPGGLAGDVQGRAPRPYRAKLLVDAFAASTWEQIIAAMAGEAVYLVKLLGDELPDGTDELLQMHGVALLPDEKEGIGTTCTCTEPQPCKHVAALAYVLAELLATSPLLAFSLRGMPSDRLRDRLRQARALKTRGVATAHVDPLIADRVTPRELSECVEEFWSGRPEEETPPPKHVSHALLRRLGPSPLTGKFPFVGLLASIYDSVAEHAIQIRDHAEHLDANGEAGDERRAE